MPERDSPTREYVSYLLAAVVLYGSFWAISRGVAFIFPGFARSDGLDRIDGLVFGLVVLTAVGGVLYSEVRNQLRRTEEAVQRIEDAVQVLGQVEDRLKGLETRVGELARLTADVAGAVEEISRA